MLSTILSRLSWWAFAFTILVGLCKITSQALQTPLTIKTGSKSFISLGKPGISVTAQKNTPAETTLLSNSGEFAGPTILQTNFIRESLHINPSNGWQRAGFVLYDLINYGSLALLLFLLSRLFRNFGKQNYFSYSNLTYLKRTAWFFLAPQVAALLIYWLFLRSLHPVAGGISNPIVADYDILPGTDWKLVALGVVILALGYLFRNGLYLKEEQDLTV